MNSNESLTVSTKQKSTNLEKFLDSTDGDTGYSQQSTCRLSTSIYANEEKQYRQLASNFISGPGEDKSALVFWKYNIYLLPNLSTLSRSYLVIPAIGVLSESALSKSADCGPKERANIYSDKLCQLVFLKDKLFTKVQRRMLELLLKRIWLSIHGITLLRDSSHILFLSALMILFAFSAFLENNFCLIWNIFCFRAIKGNLSPI